MPSATVQNYTVTGFPGTLYVNPSGDGAKAVRPILICIDEIPDDGSGYTYVAHYEYENKNSTDVYVPVGENNLLYGTGKFSNANQPKLFKSGGGTFDIPFDGQKLVWKITSIESGKKASVASEASSSSSKCAAKTPVLKSASIKIPNVDREIDVVTVLYPNPAAEKIIIEMNELSENSRITIMDLKGVSYQVKKISLYKGHLELDVQSLPSGLYIVGISDGALYGQMRFIKK